MGQDNRRRIAGGFVGIVVEAGEENEDTTEQLGWQPSNGRLHKHQIIPFSFERDYFRVDVQGVEESLGFVLALA